MRESQRNMYTYKSRFVGIGPKLPQSVLNLTQTPKKKFLIITLPQTKFCSLYLTVLHFNYRTSNISEKSSFMIAELKSSRRYEKIDNEVRKCKIRVLPICLQKNVNFHLVCMFEASSSQ